jgi:hypothetical protein
MANSMEGGTLNAFTFFREDRPLGDNPWPPNSRLWEMFEEHTALTKEKLDSVWIEFQQRYNPMSTTAPEILKLKLTARLTRLDIKASQALKASPPVDEALSKAHENWLEGLMEKERTDVLDLVNKGASSEADAQIWLDFNENEFTRLLALKLQEYKRALHLEATRLIRERRLTRKAAAQHTESATVRKGGRPPAVAIIGDKVIELRGEASQEAFARRTGLSVDVIQRAEQGEATVRTINKLLRFAKSKAFSMTADSLIKNPPLKAAKT